MVKMILFLSFLTVFLVHFTDAFNRNPRNNENKLGSCFRGKPQQFSSSDEGNQGGPLNQEPNVGHRTDDENQRQASNVARAADLNIGESSRNVDDNERQMYGDFNAHRAVENIDDRSSSVDVNERQQYEDVNAHRVDVNIDASSRNVDVNERQQYGDVNAHRADVNMNVDVNERQQYGDVNAHRADVNIDASSSSVDDIYSTITYASVSSSNDIASSSRAPIGRIGHPSYRRLAEIDSTDSEDDHRSNYGPINYDADADNEDDPIDLWRRNHLHTVSESSDDNRAPPHDKPAKVHPLNFSDDD